jgi:nitrate reductase gamma subunit
MMSIVFAILLYLATLLFVVGLLHRINTYARTPAPLKIPTTPAPTTSGGVVLRMAREVVFFESLFRANLWIWSMGWLFHASMALVLLRHLRYFTEPVWVWVAAIQPFGLYAGFALLAGLLGLWARRMFV